MSENKDIKYALPIGTVLKNPKKWGSREYSIEPVMDGKPVDRHSRFRFKGPLSPVLGQGGYGITYLASSVVEIGNTSHKVYFAIKEFFEKGVCYRDGDDPTMKFSPAAKEEIEDGLKDFITEATRLNKICVSNKNIVNVNEVFEANGTAYYVMEFLDGGNLRDKIKDNGGGFSVDEALPYFLPISNAVSYIHNSHKLLHCDIKPDNIMLRVGEDGNEEPVLIDFGISLHFNSKGNLTSTHNTVGASDGYAPPEQYRGIDRFCPEVDVYALSATLFYLLTGHNPIQSFEISDSYIDTKLPQSVDNKVRIAIQKGMRKSQDERTHSISELVNSLSSFTNVGKQENIKEESGGRTRKFGTKKTRNSSFADKLKNFFKSSEENIKKENESKEKEKETEEKTLTQPISLSRPSATLVTFINESSLLIYFRGNTYVYGGRISSDTAFKLLDPIFDAPLHRLKEIEKENDIYERQNEKLFRLSRRSSYALLQHVERYGYIIEKGINFALYSNIDEYLQLSELSFSCNSQIKVERLIHENQFLVFSKKLDIEGIERVNIGDTFVDVDYFEKGVFEVLSMGQIAKDLPVANKEFTLNADMIFNDIIEGCLEFYNNLQGKGSMPIYPTLPYSISYSITYFTKEEKNRHYFPITESYSVCPFKMENIVIDGLLDDKSCLFIYLDDINLDGKLLNLNIRKFLKYIPKSAGLSVKVGLNCCIIFEFKDLDKNEILGECSIGDLVMDSDPSVDTIIYKRF